MRPLRSVRHSPRLTKRNGVLTRTAPASTASGTPQYPIAAVVAGSAIPRSPSMRHVLLRPLGGRRIEDEVRDSGYSVSALESPTSPNLSAPGGGEEMRRERVQ